MADWLGHESVDMTRREYEHNARLQERLHRGEWILRLARRPTDKIPKIAVSVGSTGGD